MISARTSLEQHAPLPTGEKSSASSAFLNLVRFLSCELSFCKSTYFESLAIFTLHHAHRCGKTSA